MSSNVLRRLLKTDMLDREVNRVEEPKEGVEGAGKCTVELMQLRPHQFDGQGTVQYRLIWPSKIDTSVSRGNIERS